MKKTVTLMLVLVMALGLALPALAYTTNTPPASGGGKYTVDIYLVDYTGNDYLSGMILKPPVDRGYAKNEIVAAVAALTIPARADVWEDGYTQLVLSGKNASLNVTDNGINGTNAQLLTSFPYDSAANRGIAPNTFRWNSGDNAILHDITTPTGNVGGEIVAPTSAVTYRILFFAKVTGDKASLSFRLSKNAQFENSDAAWKSTGPFQQVAGIATSDAAQHIVLNKDYVAVRQENGNYIIFENNSFNNTAVPGNPLFRIEVNAKGATQRLYMYTGAFDGPLYRVHTDSNRREISFLVYNGVANKMQGDQITSTDPGYAALRYLYDTHFAKGLGFSVLNEGNVLDDADFRAIANADDVLETVNIEPWTPYVQTPNYIVTSPPKTGNASLMGFVFLAIAGLAAVATVKVRKQHN